MRRAQPRSGENTTIGVVATNAKLTKVQAQKVAQMAHDGYARAISPVHTPGDGDTDLLARHWRVGQRDPEPDHHRRAGRGGDGRRDRARGHPKRDPRRYTLGAGAGYCPGTVQIDMARIDRRSFVRQSLAGSAGIVASSGAVFGRAPAIIQSDASLPSLPYGIAAGAAGPDRFVVWSRSDRPARMLVEYATTERFAEVKRIIGPAALEGTDFTARTSLAGLPRGQRIFIASASRISPTCAGSAALRPGASLPLRRQPRRATSPSPGRPIPWVKAGGSIPSGVACVSSRRS